MSPDKQKEMFPDFFLGIKLNVFRHLKDLEVNFRNPVTVITGSNRTGKSSLLLSIGCSHFNFYTRSAVSGDYERTRWSNVMRFTQHDVQKEDWSYEVEFRENGHDAVRRPGKRSARSKKWSGCAKKEGQIGHPKPRHAKSPDGRNVYLIDMERIIPGRHHPQSIYSRVKNRRGAALNKKAVYYLSYVLEVSYRTEALGNMGERKIYKYQNDNSYTTFNTASGEDVLTHLIEDIVLSPSGSLILIEEIEIGLHPRIQRRLMDVLYAEAALEKKQFIVTSHSSTIIESVEPQSRILLVRNSEGTIVTEQNVSVCRALNAMDSISHPLLSIYVEDDISKRLVEEALEDILIEHEDMARSIKIVEIGSADKTYSYYQNRQATHSTDNLRRGAACILDGDMRNEKDRAGHWKYPKDQLLYFHQGNEAPEKMLVRTYLKYNYNSTLEYHLNDGNPHKCFSTMVELGLAMSEGKALEKCIKSLRADEDGRAYLADLANFILNACKHYSSII